MNAIAHFRRTSAAFRAERGARASTRCRRRAGNVPTRAGWCAAELLETRALLSTYYVSASSGADGNAGTSDAAPFETLQKAGNTVRAGDTVIVRAGTYSAGMTLVGHTGGTASAPIRFLADPGATITRSATSGPNASKAAINLESTGGWFVVAGFTITDADRTTERAGIRVASSAHVVVRDNTIDGAYDGIFVSQSDSVLIEHNVTRNAYGEHGIYVNGSAGYVIRGNECYGNPWNGIHTNVSVEANLINSGGLIENNLVHDNDLAGMDFAGMQDAIVRNNLVYGNGRHGMVFQNEPASVGIPACRGNTIVNNTLDARDGSSAYAIQFAADATGATSTSNDADTTVFNNILLATIDTGNGSIGLVGGTSATFRSDFNVVVDAFRTGATQQTLASWRSGAGQDANSVISSGTSLFVGTATDYHLKAGAPALDFGVAGFNGQDAPAADVAGDVRPQGGGFDVGAYESPDTTAPTASAALAGSVGAPGGDSFTFTVTYRDDAGVLVSSIDGGDILVRGPDGFAASASLVALDSAVNGTTRVATYRVAAPGGSWDYRDNGTYTLSLLAGQVTDTSGNPAAATALGSFAVNILDATPTTVDAVAIATVGENSARITWSTDEPTDAVVEYGTTPSYGLRTPLGGTLSTRHSVGLHGLLPLTTYHYRVLSRDAAGNLTTSTDASFTTTAATLATPPVVGDVALTAMFSSPGQAGSFTATYSDPNGWTNLEWVYLRANADLPVMLDALYNVQTNKLYLRAGNGTTLLGGFAPGSDNVIANSCGSLDCSAVSVSGGGAALTVTWNLTAGQPLAGVNRLFVRARDRSGLDTGYQQTSGATWTVNGSRPPTTAADATSVTSAAGQPHAFTATYSDPDGWANLGWVHLRLNTYLPTLLEAIYNVATNKLYLRDAAGTGVIGGFAPGSANVITAANGSLNCAAVSVVRSGDGLRVNWDLVANQVLAGSNPVFTRAVDRAGYDTGYQQSGGATWTITGNQPPQNVAVLPAAATESAGSAGPIAASYSDADGWANLNFVFLTLNRNDPTRRLEVIYIVQNNRLYLKADDNVTLLGGFAPGSSNVIRNSRGSLDCAATRVTRAGNTITVIWALQATDALAGSNTLWLRTSDRGGNDTLYQEQIGAQWLVTPALTSRSVTL